MGTSTVHRVKASFAGVILAGSLAFAASAHATNGQSGIFSSASTTGGTNAFQANPGGSFGFGATQTISPATDLAYRIVAVPEPSTYAMMGVGAIALGAMLRLRRRAN